MARGYSTWYMPSCAESRPTCTSQSRSVGEPTGACRHVCRLGAEATSAGQNQLRDRQMHPEPATTAVRLAAWRGCGLSPGY